VPEKKPSIHKTILILIMVFLPPFFLVFTDDGRRLSDTALLWLLGKAEVRVNLEELDDRFTREDVNTLYTDVEWHCGAQRTPFGDNLCSGDIGTFNGYPAQVLNFYFRGEQLSGMKMIYRDQYHLQIQGYLIGQLGQPDNVEEAVREGPDAAEVIEWGLPNGMLVMKKELNKGDEPSLVWLAGDRGQAAPPREG
jgi:hypothetical protein